MMMMMMIRLSPKSHRPPISRRLMGALSGQHDDGETEPEVVVWWERVA
jgi:hypothetical protein